MLSSPEILEFHFSRDSCFVIIASEGLWQRLPSESAVSIVAKQYFPGGLPNLAATMLESGAGIHSKVGTQEQGEAVEEGKEEAGAKTLQHGNEEFTTMVLYRRLEYS